MTTGLQPPLFQSTADAVHMKPRQAQQLQEGNAPLWASQACITKLPASSMINHG